jgi:hypothetical protein
VGAAAGEGVKSPFVADDGDVDALDGEDAHEAWAEVGYGGHTMKLRHPPC